MTFIKKDNQILAIIISADFKKEGLTFFTPNDFSQQLAFMHHPKGHKIVPHIHNLQIREIKFTLETLFVRSGKIKVDFYDDDKNYVDSYILKTGDVILLASGGHGLTFLEPSDVIEVKQGPYVEGADKIRFEPKGFNDDSCK